MSNLNARQPRFESYGFIIGYNKGQLIPLGASTFGVSYERRFLVLRRQALGDISSESIESITNYVGVIIDLPMAHTQITCVGVRENKG